MAYDLKRSIASQMIRGFSGKPVSVPDDQLGQILNTFGNIIDEVINHMPRNGSSAVGAVVCKCAAKYGHDKALDFLDKLRNGSFTGPKDPVLLLWNYLLRTKNKRTTTIYRNTVTAARAFCDGRQLTHLRAADSDIG